MPNDFNNFQNNIPPKPSIRIILSDIMDCFVKLKRLSSSEIERATNVQKKGDNHRHSHTNQQQHNLLASHRIDHSYSVLSLPTTNEEKTATPQPKSSTASEVLNVDYASSSPSSLCSSNLSYTESDDDDDNDDFDETQAIAYPSINLESIDDMTPSQNNVERLNGFVIPNGINGSNSRIGINHLNGSSYLNGNGMRSHPNPNESPNQAMNDEDDDVRFLNDLKVELDESVNENGTTENYDENGKSWPSIRIFGNVCLKSLTDACLNPYCENRHELPSIELFQSHLNAASAREILEVQNNLLLRYNKLMDEFFETFCFHCGRKWQYHRENLRRMIEPLSTRPLAAIYMENIVNGFLTSGMKFSTCVNQLMLEIDSSLNMDDQFNILWALIIDPRNEKIVEHLNYYEPVFVGNALAIVAAINRLLEYQVNVFVLDDLREFIVNLVQKCRIETFRRLDSKLLKGFIAHVRTFDLNASKMIEQKALQFNFMAHCQLN